MYMYKTQLLKYPYPSSFFVMSENNYKPFHSKIERVTVMEDNKIVEGLIKSVWV